MFYASPCCLATFPFMCLLSPCSCSKCLVIIVTFSWMSARPVFGLWRGELSRDSRHVRVKPRGGGGGWGDITERYMRIELFLSDIQIYFRNECILFTMFCFLLCWFLKYSTCFSIIAQLTYVRAQLWAQMPVLPDDRAEWKQDIKLLIFLYYFCLRNMDLDVIHFWNAFKVNLIKSNLKMKLYFTLRNSVHNS